MRAAAARAGRIKVAGIKAIARFSTATTIYSKGYNANTLWAQGLLLMCPQWDVTDSAKSALTRSTSYACEVNPENFGVLMIAFIYNLLWEEFRASHKFTSESDERQQLRQSGMLIFSLASHLMPTSTICYICSLFACSPFQWFQAVSPICFVRFPLDFERHHHLIDRNIAGEQGPMKDFLHWHTWMIPCLAFWNSTLMVYTMRWHCYCSHLISRIWMSACKV